MQPSNSDSQLKDSGISHSQRLRDEGLMIVACLKDIVWTALRLSRTSLNNKMISLIQKGGSNNICFSNI
jgi:hypothetical protein